ncbi:hypothetical protein FACS189468_0920 [Spirochaetia bacterium]|nr:hypothetical protein FACS189468_0920 [Spirochaetia bacterium]
MKNLKLIALVSAFLIVGSVIEAESLGAAEYTNGRIRLVLHENTGRYSLYFLTNTNGAQYEPFFVDQDPRTSFLTLLQNDRAYRLGEASSFKVRIGGTPAQPALIFESPALLVTQEFSFICTYGSALCNGVRIRIRIENRGDQVSAGLRLLLDTSLGEGREPGAPSFITETQQISSETLMDGSGADRWWISRNDHLGLMGSISGEDLSSSPDFIHFANWKRFNDTPWKLSYEPGRNFNFPPYSIGDSAVCYYFEPRVLRWGESRIISLILAAEDVNGFAMIRNAPVDQVTRPVQQSPASGAAQGIQSAARTDIIRTDLAVLRDLISKMDQYILYDTPISDEELAAMERRIAQLKARYGL